jgi:hypothetical protein
VQLVTIPLAMKLATIWDAITTREHLVLAAPAVTIMDGVIHKQSFDLFLPTIVAQTSAREKAPVVVHVSSDFPTISIFTITRPSGLRL